MTQMNSTTTTPMCNNSAVTHPQNTAFSLRYQLTNRRDRNHLSHLRVAWSNRGATIRNGRIVGVTERQQSLDCWS